MKYEPYKFIIMLFLSIILVASIILWLPISHVDGVQVSYIDSLFTTTSALCVTGLNTIDFVNTFNTFGLVIIALLIQLGGLGIVCVSIIVFLAIGKKIGLKHRLLIKNSFNLNSMKGIVKFILSVFKITLVIEGIGAVILTLNYMSDYDFVSSLGMASFHSISAFNNAGFDVISKYGMFDGLSKVITMILIILGGIGFVVISEVLKKGLNFKKYSLQAKIVLVTTVSLLLGGTIIYFVVTDLNLFDSLFLSISTRTAGFSYFDLSNINNPGYLLSILLMLIGASPSSTGGGIKTVTFFVLVLAFYCICRKRNYEIYGRSISKDIVNKCLVILLASIIVIFGATFLMSCFEPLIGIKEIFFEIVSAYATVGLSLGITSALTTASKIILCIVMFVGRVGILTLLSVWLTENQKNVSYPEEDIIVG